MAIEDVGHVLFIDDGEVLEHQLALVDLLRTQEFHLIESKLKPTGAEYTTLQTFRFATEA